MPVGTSGPALHVFSGTLSLATFTMSMNRSYDNRFPNISMKFVSDGDDLIPVERDILTGTNTGAWQILLEPGRVWSETADQGWSRASFPFELLNDDAVYNGLATFLYNDSEVSSMRMQIVQEVVQASPPSIGQADMWATFGMTYSPVDFPDKATVIAQYQQEKANYLPVRPWEDIESQAGMTAAQFNGGMPDEEVSFSGIAKDGIIYRQPCHSRYGDYPYCQQMRTASYSIAKSMGNAIAFLRLAEKYGDGVGQLLIKDYVNVTATHNGWNNVTFLDALNMATGIGDEEINQPLGTGNFFEAEDNDPLLRQFFAEHKTSAMLDLAFQEGKYSWGPGVEARYNNMQAFILSAAMDAYLKTQEGPTADLWNMVADEVYKPIGIAHAPALRSIKNDGSKNIAMLFTGLYPTADDIAKLGQLLHDDGMFNGQQILSPTLTQTALYRASNQGLRGTNGYNSTYGANNYLMSFFGSPWSNGTCTVRIPFMSGGDLSNIAILPNGAIVFRMTNGGFADLNVLFRAGANLGDIC